MAYITADDFITAFSETEWLQLTDRDRDDIADDGVGDAAFENASGVVDGYVRAIYVVPLSVIDPCIKQITLDIARWILTDDEASERVLAGYESAMRMLRDIAAQKIVLSAELVKAGGDGDGDGDGNGDIGYSSPGLAYSKPPPVFARQPVYRY